MISQFLISIKEIFRIAYAFLHIWMNEKTNFMFQFFRLHLCVYKNR